jgi:outer membrane protein insertion porin family
MKRFIVSALVSLFLLTTASVYADSFILNNIQFEGLERISPETAASYVPAKTGDTIDSAKSVFIIKALYSTDFFKNVDLYRQGNNLLIKVQERQTISAVTITGNKNIPTDKLTDAFANLGLKQGDFLDHAVLEQVDQALLNQYYSTGRYNVKVNIEQVDEPRNRADININISEGRIAHVESIKILGNKDFPESELLNQLALSKPSILTFFNRDDEYSDDKMQQSENNLRNFYLDNGYLDVRIDSNEVALAPDREHVYITLHVIEGPQFSISGFDMTGQFAGQEPALLDLITLGKGEIFSRDVVLNIASKMTNLLGNYGYAFALITPQPEINEQNHTVFIHFNVAPGNRYYIRNINFTGNESTSETALRNQLYQMEGGLYSNQNIQNSLFNLRNDSYLGQDQPATVTPQKVPGSDDLVDLETAVSERLSAQLSFSVGYSEVYGPLLSAGVSQANFMGSGKTVGLNISTSEYQSSVSASYTNPYYTPDGVSRTVSLFGSQTNASELSLVQYTNSSYGANVSYGFPLSVYSSLNLGYGISHTELTEGGVASSTVQNFIDQYGTSFEQLTLTAGWSNRTTDRAVLPTTGVVQSLTGTVSVPISNHPLQYYTLAYQNNFYVPLAYNFILMTYATAGYGNGYGGMPQLPFFDNFYAGGIGVQGINRAYAPYSLGQLDPVTGNPLGGNLLLDASLGLALPNFTGVDTIRTSVFLDGGNVFDTYNGQPPFDLQQIRYSYGAQIEWWTPLGVPLIFSLAFPINNQPGDNLEPFQFTLGSAF